MTRIVRIVVAGAGLALLVAACGDAAGDVGTPPTSDSVATTTSSISTTTAPTTTPTSTPPSDVSCSGATVEVGEGGGPFVGGEDDLPGPVADLARRIITAANECDYERLAELAGPQFSFTFGGADDPVAFWRDLEARGEPVTARMIQVLGFSHDLLEVADPDIYVWPAVAGEEPTEADWDEVRDLYSDADIASMKEYGGYLGWRLGIASDGTWMSFVAGD